MDEKTLVKIIDSNVNTGIGGDDGDISNTRRTVFDRYMGEVYGNEKQGKSKITTREVFETVEWAMPSIVRVFESGDRIIEFDAVSEQDELAAEQETAAVNHIYQKDNNGFIVTHNLIKSCLMNPNSYVEVYRDEAETVTTENYKSLNDAEITLLAQDEEIEIIGAEEGEYGYDVEIKRTCKKGRVRVQVCPEEEVIIHQNHSELNLDECEFACRDTEKTHSELIQLGYDENDLEEARSQQIHSGEESNRKFYADENDYDDESHKALRKYRVQICYMLLDWDNDGVAERRRVVKVGNKIFENEEMDYMALCSAASIIMPHKHTGMSLAQAIIDLQDLKTYFMRQLINNMARTNNPRTFINENVNLADALSNRENGFIRVKGDPRMAASSEPVQPIVGQVLPLLELIDQQKEGRSGITRNSMGLDADILAKSTEGAFMGAIEKAEQRVEFIVRVLAETIFKDIFLKIHHIALTHGDVKQMKLNGQWIAVDPSEWKKRESMTVNVGLGVSNRQQKRITAQMIVQDHDKLLQAGAMGTLISPQNVFNGRRLLVEAAGERSVDKYYINPQLQPPQQPQPPAPDPNMLMIQSNERIEQSKMQAKMAEIQQKGQIELARFQFDQAKAARELQFNENELQLKNQIESLKSQVSQAKNDNDAGAKALQAKIDQLEMQLEDTQAAEKLAMDKYKADLDSETKITLKQMDRESLAEPIIEENQDKINNAIASMAKIISDMQQPKEIIKDENDSPIGVRNVTTGEVRTIIKDNQGLPVGIE